MLCIIMANGEYSAIDFYTEIINKADIIICADGGANQAFKMGIIPSYIIGDMDSIEAEILKYFRNNKVILQKFPCHKDFTDTQLALSFAEELGATEIIFLGSLGKRLDHTLSNLYCSMETVLKGISVVHMGKGFALYLVADSLMIKGCQGDVVSVLSLTDFSYGVTEQGFKYPLEKAILENKNPYAVSNELIGEEGIITVEKGVIAVIHYYSI